MTTYSQKMLIHVKNKLNQATAIPRDLIDYAFTRMNKQL